MLVGIAVPLVTGLLVGRKTPTLNTRAGRAGPVCVDGAMAVQLHEPETRESKYGSNLVCARQLTQPVCTNMHVACARANTRVSS